MLRHPDHTLAPLKSKSVSRPALKNLDMNRQGPVEGGFKKKKAKSSLTECDRDAKEQVAHRRNEEISSELKFYR